MSTGANGVVQLENEFFRVTEWTIQPGGVIPMHRHDYEYVVVPMVTDRMHVVLADGGVILAELEAGVSYTRPAGSEHQVENRTSASPIVFVEIERLS
ncbi:quercetin dioxygenase-like cupin family protein [Leucobacter exalbidus]|uniref:Quercetin dioxygenase-like cupin family protein n=1 Tax=Leucobacter exalbidus TaxID=662960 RepID=A0A940T187_9MICO|nr:cupin domain-containing protein [Leucobacter exalbidus]MBP1326625.1 quercetin dioxygenase-like cupin family protein [Leucobacter exalbidus]